MKFKLFLADEDGTLYEVADDVNDYLLAEVDEDDGEEPFELDDAEAGRRMVRDVRIRIAQITCTKGPT